jgi:hypothetical protein
MAYRSSRLTLVSLASLLKYAVTVGYDKIPC